ncbi:MAG: helix-turn-helix domain-containing protein [bacterium]|nr:helix-turn-helix domain-containing protein [bacterium]
MTPDQLVEFAEGLGRIAAAGGGATALAAYLAERTGAGVLLEDAAWRHVASAGARSLPATARGAARDTLATLPVGAADAPSGWLSVVAPKGQLAGLAAPARLCASAIAVEWARDAGGTRARRRPFWEALLAASHHDLSAIRDDAAARGIALAAQYCCAVLEAETSEGAPPAASDLRALAAETFRGGDIEIGIVERGATLVVFIPAEREVDATRARTAAQLLPKSAAKRNASLRVTGAFVGPAGVHELGHAVESAESALAIVRRMYGTGMVCAAEDLGAYPLLYRGASVEQLRAFALDALAPLRAYDDKQQTELERTLRVYFAAGQNVKTAAAELNVHRHTVFYRLRQIGEITGRALEDPHDQLTLRLAMAIHALHT